MQELMEEVIEVVAKAVYERFAVVAAHGKPIESHEQWDAIPISRRNDWKDGAEAGLRTFLEAQSGMVRIDPPIFLAGAKVTVKHERYTGEGIVSYDTGVRRRMIGVLLSNGNVWEYEAETVRLTAQPVPAQAEDVRAHGKCASCGPLCQGEWGDHIGTVPFGSEASPCIRCGCKNYTALAPSAQDSQKQSRDDCGHEWVCGLDQQQCMEDCQPGKHDEHHLICKRCGVPKSHLPAPAPEPAEDVHPGIVLKIAVAMWETNVPSIPWGMSRENQSPFLKAAAAAYKVTAQHIRAESEGK